jgi:hypothetical protein
VDNRRPDRKYEVTVNDGKEITVKTVTAAEKEALDPQAFDLYMSPADGVLGFRDAKGNWVEYRNRWPGLGPVCIAIIQALQLNCGDFLSPKTLSQLCGFDSLHENSVLAARAHAIRKALRDPGARFIETRTSNGYALRWPRERTFLWVELIPPSA